MNDWCYAVGGLGEDFGLFGDIDHLIRVTVRLMLAATCGGLLGYQRERTGKAAGLRTHMLVAVGAAFFALAPLERGMSLSDISRVIQGIVTGIGFIGAGAILKQTEQGAVRGLTTAAGIWLTCAIGVAIGIGQMVAALIGTVLALVVLAVIPRISRWAEEEDETRPS
ncbi:MAG TPA: MgtC/SapB family protein [Gemmataceae bacterium]|jgi:putative Mg2+ transporter-C (MgtC) family protein|nr:MgtC/SapB family protein [Gemmataceae bacterium]